MTSAIELNDHTLELEEIKQVLRQQIRSERNAQGNRQRRDAAAGLAEQVLPLLTDDVQVVASYASRPTEPDTELLHEVLHARGKKILLPVLGPGLTREWAFWQPGEPLEVVAPGRPPEPQSEPVGEDGLRLADLVLVPALSVDTRGIRLGQGGGWYDRALIHRRSQVPAYGIIFDHEFSQEPLPFAAHDQPVLGVITPLRRWLIETDFTP